MHNYAVYPISQRFPTSQCYTIQEDFIAKCHVKFACEMGRAVEKIHVYIHSNNFASRHASAEA